VGVMYLMFFKIDVKEKKSDLFLIIH